MATHQEIVSKLMKRPGVKAEVERIEREHKPPRSLAWSVHWQLGSIRLPLPHCESTSIHVGRN
jgi:hypothetical protein